MRRLSATVGGQPRPAAPWLFGPWVQTGHSNTEPDELDDLARLRAADAPYSAVETHMRYMPCGSDLGQERAPLTLLHAGEPDTIGSEDVNKRSEDGLVSGAEIAAQLFGRQLDCGIHDARARP